MVYSISCLIQADLQRQPVKRAYHLILAPTEFVLNRRVVHSILFLAQELSFLAVENFRFNRRKRSVSIRLG